MDNFKFSFLSGGQLDGLSLVFGTKKVDLISTETVLITCVYYLEIFYQKLNIQAKKGPEFS